MKQDMAIIQVKISVPEALKAIARFKQNRVKVHIPAKPPLSPVSFRPPFRSMAPTPFGAKRRRADRVIS